jgi:hypothetical protein
MKVVACTEVCTKNSDGLANAAKELSFHLFRGT